MHRRYKIHPIRAQIFLAHKAHEGEHHHYQPWKRPLPPRLYNGVVSPSMPGPLSLSPTCTCTLRGPSPTSGARRAQQHTPAFCAHAAPLAWTVPWGSRLTLMHEEISKAPVRSARCSTPTFHSTWHTQCRCPLPMYVQCGPICEQPLHFGARQALSAFKGLPSSVYLSCRNGGTGG